MMDGLRKLGMLDGNEKDILSRVESLGGRKDAFKFLTCPGQVKRI